MNNLYLKGTTTNTKELYKILKTLDENQLETYPLYPSYESLTHEEPKQLGEIINYQILKHVKKGEKYNLICHSLGCNLGVLAASETEKIEKLVLISPNLTNIEEKERQRTIKIKRKKYKEETKNKLSLDNIKKQLQIINSKEKIKNLILFKKTQKLAKQKIETINIPILVIFSEGDEYISKKYMKYLSEHENTTVYSIPSTNHNPLLDETNENKTATLIKKFIQN